MKLLAFFRKKKKTSCKKEEKTICEKKSSYTDFHNNSIPETNTSKPNIDGTAVHEDSHSDKESPSAVRQVNVPPVVSKPNDSNTPFMQGDIVVHIKDGTGTVLFSDANKTRIKYDNEIVKTYSTSMCTQYGFIKALEESGSLGYNAEGYDRHGYDKNGFNRSGYSRKGYDKYGYNTEGYDMLGYDRDGYDKSGYYKDGYNRDGFDKHGYDRDGYDFRGYDKDGYDRDGYDKAGYDRDGYDKHGRDWYGYNRNGYNRYGYDIHGNNKNGDYLDIFDKANKNKKPRASVKYVYGNNGFSMKVSGVTYDNRQDIISKLKTGQELRFVAEPSNSYDHHAVKIETLFGEQIGYVPRAQNSQIFSNLINNKGSYQIYVSSITGGGIYSNLGCIIRVIYNI